MGGLKLAISEFDLIEKYIAPLTSSGAPAFALSNDAAVYRPNPGKEIVITKDTLVAGVHFFDSDPPDLIAKKALRVNLSDLASMGAEPLGYLLSLSLQKDENQDLEKWLKEFTYGLREDQEKFNWALWGGDTVSTPGPFTVSVTAIGQVDEGVFSTRNGAKSGDDIYVSGDLGDSAMGLRLMKNGRDYANYEYFIKKYHLPEPRVTLGRELVPHVTSMMDVSDGLMGDISHICKQSGVGASIVERKIPVSENFGNLLETKKEYSRLKWCGGDDYELLFTAPPENKNLISDLGEKLNVKLTKIGEITEDQKIVLIDDAGSILETGKEGYRHF